MEIDVKISVLLYRKEGEEERLVINPQFSVSEFRLDEPFRDDKLSILDEIRSMIRDKVEEIKVRRLEHSD